MPLIGRIIAWAGENSARNRSLLKRKGFLICDGEQVSQADYHELFDMIHDNFSDGKTPDPDHFYLPDFSNRVPVGATNTHPLGDYFGHDTHTLTKPQMPSHKHKYNKFEWWGSGNRNDTLIERVNTGRNTVTSGHRGQLDESEPSGGGKPHNNMQPSLAIHYLIQFRENAVNSVKGRVVDANNREKLSGVLISVKDGPSATTNNGGNYTIEEVRVGLATLIATKRGYSPITQDVQVSEEGPAKVNFELTPQ